MNTRVADMRRRVQIAKMNSLCLAFGDVGRIISSDTSGEGIDEEIVAIMSITPGVNDHTYDVIADLTIHGRTTMSSIYYYKGRVASIKINPNGDRTVTCMYHPSLQRYPNREGQVDFDIDTQLVIDCQYIRQFVDVSLETHMEHYAWLDRLGFIPFPFSIRT